MMSFSGKTHPAQVTRLLHSAPVEGSHPKPQHWVQLPQFLKKLLTWYCEYREQSTFCTGTTSSLHSQLFPRSEATDMLRHLNAASIPEAGTVEVGGEVRNVRKGCAAKPPFTAHVSDLGVWISPEPSQI